MADIKISQLGAAASISDSDVIPMTANGVTVKAAASLLKEYAIGDTSLSGLGDGTATGAIDAVNSAKVPKSDIAPTQTSVASNAIASGEEFYLNGVLMKATAAIAQGDQIISGTNCTPANTITSDIQTLTNGLANEVVTRATLGAHNLLEQNNLPGTNDTLTASHSTDGGIRVRTISATTAAAYVRINKNSTFLPAGDYVFSCSGTSSGVDQVYIYNVTTSQTLANISTPNFTYNGTDSLVVYYALASGKTVDKTVYPMIRLASDPSTEFTPYVKTNRELTEVAQQTQGNYVLSDNAVNISVAGNGVKTIAELLNEIYTAFNTYRANMETNDFVEVKGVTIAGISDFAPQRREIHVKNLTYGVAFGRLECIAGSSTIINYAGIISSASSLFSASLVNGAAPNVSNLGNNVLASGSSISLRMNLYKKIS